MPTITPNSLVFTWDHPQDKSIQKLKITLKDKGGDVVRTEIASITASKQIEISLLKKMGSTP